MESEREGQPLEWTEEQLRYRILRAVYDQAGGDCVETVTATEIGAGLGLAHEDLFRSLNLLEQANFLFRVDDEPSVCVTPKGIRYLEKHAGRRRSVRLPKLSTTSYLEHPSTPTV